MRVICLPEQNYQVLLRVFAEFCGAGIAVGNLRAVADTFSLIEAAQDVPEPTEHLGSAKITSLAQDGLKLEVPLHNT